MGGSCLAAAISRCSHADRSRAGAEDACDRMRDLLAHVKTPMPNTLSPLLGRSPRADRFEGAAPGVPRDAERLPGILDAGAPAGLTDGDER